MLFTVLALAIFSVSAESPIDVEYSDFWWNKTKKTAVRFVKSIKVKLDTKAAVELMEKGIDKAKEIGKAAAEKIETSTNDDDEASHNVKKEGISI